MAIKRKVSKDKIYRIRHSLAHVLAQAVQKIYPGTLLGFGPPINDGFYYDFIFPVNAVVGEEDLPKIENEMKKIIKEEQEFLEKELSATEALEKIAHLKEPHKLEYARELINEKGLTNLTFYTNGPFVDMCEGPHVDNTNELPLDGFKLHSLAGAYWRGNEKNVMMTRIYGYAYENKAALEKRIVEVATAKERDHRKLGHQLKIFSVNDHVGKGLPLWLPNGAAIRHELEKLAYEMEFLAGYQRVATPHITKGELYRTSGHIPLYENSMYPPMKLVEISQASGTENENAEVPIESYYLKPMNCPHHHMIYASEPRSYRDLPLRLAEYGTVYRFERAGQLQGLTRVRGMTMNDAHIYVTPEQLKEEFKAVMNLHTAYYKLFGFKEYYLRLSLWDPKDPKRSNKYFNNPEAWAFTQRIAAEALDELGVEYQISEGEAAFYGPKVDFQFSTAIENEFTVSTNQIDFAVPPRFNLTYTDHDGAQKTPYCIHRAPLGTHERFIAFLIEHYGGVFPTWLAPVQVLILPVADNVNQYAKEICHELRSKLIRAEIDEDSSTFGKKIRNGLARKIPILLILGNDEQEANTVTVRRFGIEKQKTLPVKNFTRLIEKEIKDRKHVTKW